MKLFHLGASKPDPEEEYNRIIAQAIAERDALIAKTLADRETIMQCAEEQKQAILQEAENERKIAQVDSKAIIKIAEGQADQMRRAAQSDIAEMQKSVLEELRGQKRQLEQEIARMQADLNEIELKAKAYAQNDPWNDFELTDDEYAEKAKLIAVKINELIENGRAAENHIPFESNSEIAEYKRRYKQITMLFCARADLIIFGSASKNFETANRKILKICKDINRLFLKDNIQISDLLLDLKVQQCIAVYTSKRSKK